MCKAGHNPISCFLPPHVTDHMAGSEDSGLRRIALEATRLAAQARAMREITQMMPQMAALWSPMNGKYRLVYSLDSRTYPLPGNRLARQEGAPPTSDPAVDEAYDYSGITYDFYQQEFDRNSLDDRGMQLISSVHYGQDFPNALWNGFQMLYGDGDGSKFLRFTKALDVVAHELTHGVVTNSSNLAYQDEPGALNESFADVMGILVAQRQQGQPAATADWYLGGEILAPSVGAKGIRTFEDNEAYTSNPVLGTDPQPKHMRSKYTGAADFGGVHINSGIPNHAFYRTALAIGGNAWEKAGQIWYRTMLALHSSSDFEDCAAMSLQMAAQLYGSGSLEQQAVAGGWRAVGL